MREDQDREEKNYQPSFEAAQPKVGESEEEVDEEQEYDNEYQAPYQKAQMYGEKFDDGYERED